jgi:hypothetical protein
VFSLNIALCVTLSSSATYCKEPLSTGIEAALRNASKSFPPSHPNMNFLDLVCRALFKSAFFDLVLQAINPERVNLEVA